MFSFFSFISCSPTNVVITHKIQKTTESESTTAASAPCTIELTPQLDDASSFIDVFVSGADDLTMQLEMYDGLEILTREVKLSSTEAHSLDPRNALLSMIALPHA